MIQPIHYSQLTSEIAHKGCFVLEMPNEDYHRYDGISNSGLSLVARSPAHYAYRSKFEQTRHMEIGTAFHTALLEPQRYASEYVTTHGVNDRRKSEYKEAAKHYGADCTLTDKEGAGIDVMIESVRANQYATEVLNQDGWAELSAFIEDPETGVLMRCRFDWLTTDGRAVDVKKTQDCRQRPFQRAIHTYRYHCQQAMYSHIYRLITGEDIGAYHILAIEEQPPCANVLYTLDDLAVSHGHKEYRETLESYAKAVDSGVWSGYDAQADVIGLPEYVLMDIDEGQDNVLGGYE